MLAEGALILILSAGLAQGADKVLHSPGRARWALSTAAADTGRDATTLELLSIEELLVDQPPLLVLGGELEPCAGPRLERTAIERHVSDSELHLAHGEAQLAQDSLEMVQRVLSCLVEPLERRQLAQLYFLDGLAQHALGDDVAARAAFATALQFRPGLGWDPEAPAEAEPLFEQARTQVLPRVPLNIATDGLDDTLWIDGRPAVDGHISVGRHFVQIHAQEWFSYWMTVDQSEALTLIETSTVSARALSWSQKPARETDLAALLLALLGEAQVVLLPSKKGTWELTTGARMGWLHPASGTRTESGSGLQLGAALPPPPRWLGWAGATTFAASTGWTTVAYLRARSAADRVSSATNGLEQQAALADFEQADDRWILARTVAGGSAVFFAAGMSWKLLAGRSALGVAASPGGLLITWQPRARVGSPPATFLGPGAEPTAR